MFWSSDVCHRHRHASQLEYNQFIFRSLGGWGSECLRSLLYWQYTWIYCRTLQFISYDIFLVLNFQAVKLWSVSFLLCHISNKCSAAQYDSQHTVQHWANVFNTCYCKFIQCNTIRDSPVSRFLLQLDKHLWHTDEVVKYYSVFNEKKNKECVNRWWSPHRALISS